MLLRIICATPGSSREGKRTFGTHALIAGAASSSHDSTAPAVPRNRAIIKGRIRNPPRRAYIAERKSAGSRSNILECPESGQRTLRLAPGQTEINQNRSNSLQTCFVVAREPDRQGRVASQDGAVHIKAGKGPPSVAFETGRATQRLSDRRACISYLATTYIAFIKLRRNLSGIYMGRRAHQGSWEMENRRQQDERA